MSEVLLIRLGSHHQDVISWLVWSQAEQEIIASGELDNALELSAITQHAQNREVRVLVPSSDVTMKTVTLPGKFNRQIQGALPFMLEEDLTQDVDELFFAIGNKTTLDDKPAIEVAVVARRQMDEWIGWLKAAQIHSNLLMPDAMCLPIFADGVSGVELNGQWLVRSNTWECESVDNQWFEQYLQLVTLQFSQAQPEDSEAQFTFNSFSPCLAQIDHLNVVEQDPQLPLQLLLNNAQTSGFNLLQGDYLLKKESSKAWQTWKNAAIIGAVAIVLQLAYRGTTAWQLSSAVDEQKAQFVEQFKKAYPGDRTRVAMIERQIKTRLKAATSGGSDAGFLVMLSQVGPLLSQSQSFVPTIIKYDDKRGELRISATGDGFQSFEKFKTAAEKLGFAVQQGSLNNDNDKVVGTITLRSAS